jgi:hypothetical protein
MVLSLHDAVLACQFEKWYSVFRRFTEPSVIIPLDEDALAYVGWGHCSIFGAIGVWRIHSP